MTEIKNVVYKQKSSLARIKLKKLKKPQKQDLKR